MKEISRNEKFDFIIMTENEKSAKAETFLHLNDFVFTKKNDNYHTTFTILSITIKQAFAINEFI